MTATWTDPTCPVARALDTIGDRWSLLIVRDAMDGARSFSDFRARTGIARNILAARLTRLVEQGVLRRAPAASGRRQVYELTDGGADLFAVIVALRQWGERHAFEQDEPRSALLDGAGTVVPPMWPAGADGTNLTAAGTHVALPADPSRSV